MRSFQKKARWFPAVTLSLLAGASAVPWLQTETAWGGQRQFLVILADSPKQNSCVGGTANGAPCIPGAANVCPGGTCSSNRSLPDPQAIRNQYFDILSPFIRSFAEYWKEISYGDITISGQVTDWVMLPWRIAPQPVAATDPRDLNRDGVISPTDFADLDRDGVYSYGQGELFDNSLSMVGRNIGRPNDPIAGVGAKQVSSTGAQVFTPGDRFLDVNGDGVWEGLDEAANSMDWGRRLCSGGRNDGLACTSDRDCPNGTCPLAPLDYSVTDDRPDNPGPWIDLNGNGIPDNPPNCIYLPDSDNDGNPDCCPNGPGKPGCEPGTLLSCPATVVRRQNSDIFDCNGNGIPDACDISCTSQACIATGWTDVVHCGTSKDRLPLSAQGSTCTVETADGIPDECQYTQGATNPPTDCVGTVPTAPDDPCANTRACERLPADQARTPVPRCEYADVNGNGRLDIVEPFENFLHGVPFVRPVPFPPPPPPGELFSMWTPGTDYDTYITKNYPGTSPNAVISSKTVRLIGGPHDPLNKITNSSQRLCADGRAYRPIGSQLNVCPAGVHAEYHPPDKWSEAVAPLRLLVDYWKMSIGDLPNVSTSQPSWYVQAWKDRYGPAAVPPPWDSQTKTASPIATNVRAPDFNPNHGGTSGRGSGWTAGVDLSTARILPDELNGIGQPLVLYDGPVEFDDLPSSKYHRAGDQQFGEVTSPYSDQIWGQDRGQDIPFFVTTPDNVIPAAGPYATRLHGQHGHDAGDVLQMEWLTWCTNTSGPCSNNGAAWDAFYGTYPYNRKPHPYAGPVGGNFGFHDYNLDGLVDLGESRVSGSDNYLTDSLGHTGGELSVYPWNRSRVMEDAVGVLDEGLDFDDFVDRVTLDRVRVVNRPENVLFERRSCDTTGPVQVPLPVPYQGSVSVFGVCSGIVLLPAGLPQFTPINPRFTTIHNEDGLLDAVYSDSVFPDGPMPQLCWNIAFHNLVLTLDVLNETGRTSSDFLTAVAAHEYLHSWEGFPDLYDYDALDHSGVENCPMGFWDIMAKGGLVHPIPALKELKCTHWVEPVDLTTVLTPGVTKAITMPVAEFVRDDSYFFLENEDRPGTCPGGCPGERLYFWSAGSGFDEQMPGAGVLVLHADANSSNSDAVVLQQRNGIRPAFRIIQADGRNQLLSCINEGDAGDPWPGSSDNTHFACDTLPASEWYTNNACTGLEVLDIAPDGSGSTMVTFNWTPTTIPSLKFVDPPGGVTVGTIYQIRTEASDVYGGTTIRFYYKKQDTGTPDFSGSTFITPQIRKTTPGLTEFSNNWNISGVPDGRYFLFADLIPGQGADGTEAKLTRPRAGRNNQGTAKLEKSDVTVNVTTVSGTTVTTQGTARSETWVVECVDGSAGKWFVGSSLTQPLPAEEPSAALCTANPTRCATTGTPYTSIAGAVRFTIRQGTGSSPQGALGDTFTFTTTGITAPSEAVTIRNGQISEGPTAVIDASPLSGPPPLEVKFDARRSVDPNGQPLTFRWDFGDRSAPLTGPQPSHTYPNGGTFSVTLKATNPANGRFGEATVDIQVTNNSPDAVIKAAPTSGSGPLQVHFSATQSRDTETAPDKLIYQWNYGDGLGANDNGLPGILPAEVDHTYSRVNTSLDTTNCTATCACTTTGRMCTAVCPCAFTAVLTVTDEGGKKDTDSVVIRVGNTNPVAKITTTPIVLQGLSPLNVIFNAKESTDAEGDNLEVEWQWGDGSPNEKWPAKTGKPPASDGSVPHTFTLPAGATFKTNTVNAIVRDLNANGSPKGGEAAVQMVVTVFSKETLPPPPNHPPSAVFKVTPLEPFEDTVVNFDASLSSDPDVGDELRYRWIFGDESPLMPFTTNPRITHTYASAGSYVVNLTVRDKANASSDSTKTVRVLRIGDNRSPVAMIVTGLRTGSAPLTLTFDGSISFDPDGDAITSYTWEFRQDGALIETMTGSVVTRVFETPGEYTVELVVTDVDGAEGRTEPQSILVTEPTAPPPPQPPPPRPVPQEPPDSAAQRPAPSACGFGMLTGVLASFLGLTLTVVARRRLIA